MMISNNSSLLPTAQTHKENRGCYGKTKIFTAIGLVFTTGFGAIHASAADTLVASSKKVLLESNYRFFKYMTADGKYYQRIFKDNIEVSQEPTINKTIIDPAVVKKISSMGEGDILKVNLSLIRPFIATNSTQETGGAIINDGKIERLEHNGKAITDDAILAMEKELAAQLASERTLRVKAQAEKLSAFASRYGIPASRALKTALLQGNATVTLSLTGSILRKIAASNDPDLSGLELYFPTKDNISGAMLSTNINPWQMSDPAAQGTNIGLYMTESGCADEAGRTNYDRLAGSQTNHSQNVFGIMR